MPGHTDIRGNEEADRLAKEATFESPDSEVFSYAFLGLKIKQLRTQEWLLALNRYKAKVNNPASYIRRFPIKTGSKIQVPVGTKRATASAFYQLKIGHGYIKSYLYRLKHYLNDKCRCGVKETPEHLLLSYNLL